jgi:hypothetical protein
MPSKLLQNEALPSSLLAKLTKLRAALILKAQTAYDNWYNKEDKEGICHTIARQFHMYIEEQIGKQIDALEVIDYEGFHFWVYVAAGEEKYLIDIPFSRYEKWNPKLGTRGGFDKIPGVRFTDADLHIIAVSSSDEVPWKKIKDYPIQKGYFQASHKTPPFATAPEYKEDSNGWAIMPERQEGSQKLIPLEDLNPELFKENQKIASNWSRLSPGLRLGWVKSSLDKGFPTHLSWEKLSNEQRTSILNRIKECTHPDFDHKEAMLIRKVSGNKEQALKKVVKILGENGIGSIVVGAVALQELGYPRNTKDIDLSVSNSSKAKQVLLGNGYSSKPDEEIVVIDIENQEEIDLLQAGKPVAMSDVPMPMPSGANTTPVICDIETFIDLKIGSFLGSESMGPKYVRFQDRSDIHNLMLRKQLPRNLLNGKIHQKEYEYLWDVLDEKREMEGGNKVSSLFRRDDLALFFHNRKANETKSKLLERLEQLKPEIVQDIQAVYDAWGPCEGSGMCDEFSYGLEYWLQREFQDWPEVKVTATNDDRSQHFWVVVEGNGEAYGIDVPFAIYEKPVGDNPDNGYEKVPNVKFRAEDVRIFPVKDIFTHPWEVLDDYSSKEVYPDLKRTRKLKQSGDFEQSAKDFEQHAKHCKECSKNDRGCCPEGEQLLDAFGRDLVEPDIYKKAFDQGDKQRLESLIDQIYAITDDPNTPEDIANQLLPIVSKLWKEYKDKNYDKIRPEGPVWIPPELHKIKEELELDQPVGYREQDTKLTDDDKVLLKRMGIIASKKKAHDLTELLKQVSEKFPKTGWALVHKYGREFTLEPFTEQELPEALRIVKYHHRAQHCYMNAQHIAIENLSNPLVKYYEGFVSVHGVPIEHAWCTFKDKILDATLQSKTLKGRKDVVKPYDQYFGVEFPKKLIMPHQFRTKVYSPLLNDPVVLKMMFPQEFEKKAAEEDEREQLFQQLADEQRGEPEHAMLRIQHHKLGAGVYSFVVEHTGDLTNRMTMHFNHFHGGFDYVNNKVNKVLRVLQNPYGFFKEMQGNLKNNYEYHLENGTISTPFPEAVKEFRQLGKEYADAHASLKTYNQVQTFARDAAVALGKWDFYTAEDNLEKLKKILDQGEEFWTKEAGEFPKMRTAGRKNVPGTIYLLHLDMPEEFLKNNPQFHARHYLGWTESLDERLSAHEQGQGSKFMQKVKERNISWRLSRVWENKTRFDEAQMKAGGGLARYCPICKQMGHDVWKKQRERRREKQKGETPNATPEIQ